MGAGRKIVRGLARNFLSFGELALGVTVSRVLMINRLTHVLGNEQWDAPTVCEVQEHKTKDRYTIRESIVCD